MSNKWILTSTEKPINPLETVNIAILHYAHGRHFYGVHCAQYQKPGVWVKEGIKLWNLDTKVIYWKRIEYPPMLQYILKKI